MDVGTSFRGTYQLVPPPGVGFGFKKLKRGLKRVGKGAIKLNKRVIKTTIKLHTAPLKAAARAGKWAMKGLAKLAAKPIIAVVNKLAGRRARFLAYQRTGKSTVTLADKKAGGQYALGKLNKAGPIGKLAVKILKFTGGVTAGNVLGSEVSRDVRGWKQDAAMCGMTGAEIAAAAMTIVGAVLALMRSLNKPGEAPANPEAAKPEGAPETQPVLESDDAKPEGDAEETNQTEEASED